MQEIIRMTTCMILINLLSSLKCNLSTVTGSIGEVIYNYNLHMYVYCSTLHMHECSKMCRTYNSVTCSSRWNHDHLEYPWPIYFVLIIISQLLTNSLWLISILSTPLCLFSGLYTPSYGDATINGYNILTDMDQIRHNLGICPQHNILFDRLTVKEHLKFFIKLKV